MVKLFANSADPDRTPRSVASDLGLHCLPNTCLGVSSLQRVNEVCQRKINICSHMISQRLHISTRALQLTS